MFQSIRWRLIISYISLALLVVGAVGAITYQLAKNYISLRETQNLRFTAQSIALQAEPLMYSDFGFYDLQQLAETSAFFGDIRVKILDGRQRMIADSGIVDKTELAMIIVHGASDDPFPGIFFYHLDPGAPFPSALTEMLPANTITTTVLMHYGGPWGQQFISEEAIISNYSDTFETEIVASNRYRSQASLAHPIGDPLDPLGYVEVSEALDYGVNLLDDLRQALVTAGVGAVVLAVLFGLWNSYRLASPIKSLVGTSAKMGAGNLAVRANVQTGGEIGELASQFNQMADNLQASFDQVAAERDALQRFIADASHELRTPVTALKNFNTLLQGSAASDAAVQTEFLRESQAQIERLEWITQNLLDLSRLDAGLFELDLDEHDLREIIEAAVPPFIPIVEEKGVSLITQLPNHSITHLIDRPRLEMVVANLVDNALKFTPEGGEVTVSLQQEADQILIRVRDTGVGIRPQDLPHIFERFYRGRDHSAEGSGLGLAIVKSVVEAHGGQVSVKSKLSEGTKVSLIFPVKT